MVDLDKIRTALVYGEKKGCVGCPYEGPDEEDCKLNRDLLLFLTPVKPKTDSIRRFRCGACDEIIGRGQHYCGKCGREVDWNA